MDANTYKNLVNDIGGESGVLDHNIATQFDKGLLSITDFEAMSNIQTHVLAEKGFDISKLHNGKISISSGFSRGGITQGFNDPIPNTGRHRTKIMKDGKINVTTRSFSELGSVEMIVNYLGVHEFTGHGVEQWNNGYDHYKAYELQKKHKSFHGLESYYQEEIKSRFHDPVNRPDGYRSPYGWKRY